MGVMVKCSHTFLPYCVDGLMDGWMNPTRGRLGHKLCSHIGTGHFKCGKQLANKGMGYNRI